MYNDCRSENSISEGVYFDFYRSIRSVNDSHHHARKSTDGEVELHRTAGGLRSQQLSELIGGVRECIFD